MLNIVCVRAGDRFGPEYVNILHDSVRRNLAAGTEGCFIVFTDQPDTYDAGIEVRPLPYDGLTGWWNKLALFKAGVFEPGDRVLYFDLGCVITGPIDELAKYDGPSAILRDFYRSTGLQSAVMAWRAPDDRSALWDWYYARGCPQSDPGGDQAIIEQFCADQNINPVILQSEFPTLFASYKADNLRQSPPDKASVVVFHGQPKPHTILTGWVPEVWRVGGMMRAELDTIMNVAADRIRTNAQSAIARPLAWFDTGPALPKGHAVIVAGGPSLRSRLDDIRWRQSIGQSVWAMNGTARYLVANDIIPDVHVLLDARPENAAFVCGVPVLAASQCDPAVFDAAHPVTVWHANTDGMAELLAGETERPVHLIGGGSSVGLNAIVLAFAAGYRNLHLYGFDSSYAADDHHAYAQAGNDGDHIVDAIYAGKRYRTTGWMVQQVNEFQALVPGLIADGCVVTVAGDGLLPDAARTMIVPEMPYETRAAELLKRLPDGPVHGAEIGVFAGDMSQVLLARPDLSLIMVDSWEASGAAYRGDSGDWHAGLSQDAQDGYMHQAMRRAGSRGRVIRARSADAANDILDASLDFVFIDADHSYKGCAADIAAWMPKLKPGGLLAGHDYGNSKFPKFGVNRAVDELGMAVETGKDYTWFVKIPSTGEMKWPRAS